jgi:hypothetical protein
VVDGTELAGDVVVVVASVSGQFVHPPRPVVVEADDGAVVLGAALRAPADGAGRGELALAFVAGLRVDVSMGADVAELTNQAPPKRAADRQRGAQRRADLTHGLPSLSPSQGNGQTRPPRS